MLKRLEKLTATGMGMRELFEDFMKLANLTLDALPFHWEQVRNGELRWSSSPMTPPAIAEKWSGVMARYTRSDGSARDFVMPLFSEMFCILLEASDAGGEPTYKDVLGEVYMTGISHGHNGEYYTPQNIALLMAQLQNPTELLRAHLVNAIGASAFGKAMALLDVDVSQWGWDALLGCYDMDETVRAAFEPVTCCDPCCGSGVMLLSMAAACPRDAVTRGLIQFYGNDISTMAVEMCRLNFRLYGLNGWGYQLVPAREETE